MKRVLTDIAISRIEVRHRRWYRRVAAPVTEGRLRPFFPYGVHAIGIWLFVLPYLAVISGVAVLAAPDRVLSEVALVRRDPLALAAAVAGAYAVALATYHPIDKNDYGPDGNSTPTAYEEFESLLTVMGFGAFPLSYFLFLRFEAAVAPHLAVVGGSPFVASLGLGLLGILLVYAWFKHRYGHPGVNPEIASYWGFALFYVPVIVPYLAQIHFDVDLLLWGSPDEPVGAAFAVVVVVLAFLLRRLRWTVYEDEFGFPAVNPFVPAWGVPRVAFVFGVTAAWLGAPLSELVVGACFAPLVGGVAYIGWRAYVSGDLKAPPRGWISSPGRKVYEDVRRENDAKAARVRSLREQVAEFNEFAASHGVGTLPKPSLASYDPQAIEERLAEIDRTGARELTGAAFTRYAELRDAVRERVAETR